MEISSLIKTDESVYQTPNLSITDLEKRAEKDTSLIAQEL
jgi:hypothetical protein